MEWWARHPDQWNALQVGAIPAQKATDAFVSFLGDLAEDTEELAFVSDYVGFDLQFVRWYTMRFTDRDPFWTRQLDLMSYASALTRRPQPTHASRNVPERWLRGSVHDHSALQDARSHAALAIAMLSENRDDDAVDPRAGSIRGISHVTLSVTDVDRSFAFYHEVLGLTAIQRNPLGAYLFAGGTWIALHLDENTRASGRREYSHLAFYVRPEEFKVSRARLEAAKVDSWQENATEGESFYFLDPDHNKLEIHASTMEERVKHGKEHWGRDVEWFC